MKNAFITGASGHLGSCLVRYLLRDNWTVKCLINNDTRSIDGLAVEKVYVSIFDEPSLAKAMIGCDVVFHLAAIVASIMAAPLLLAGVIGVHHRCKTP